MKVVKGSVVRALAGRDQDRFFVAVAVEDRFVYIADGKERKLLNPKRKNVKHISPTDTVVETADLTDKKLRRIISAFMTRNAVNCGTDQD